MKEIESMKVKRNEKLFHILDEKRENIDEILGRGQLNPPFPRGKTAQSMKPDSEV